MGIEIKNVLADHLLWLGGNGGVRANLRGANLIRATSVLCLPLHDPRGYRPVAIAHSAGWLVSSGCRWLTQAEAREHWGDDYDGERDIGDLYLGALDWLDAQPLPEVAECDETP